MDEYVCAACRTSPPKAKPSEESVACRQNPYLKIVKPEVADDLGFGNGWCTSGAAIGEPHTH